jgi:hypothetical protein
MLVERIHRPMYGRELRGKRKPGMLILGRFEKLQHELIPALFRIADDHEIGHIDVIPSPEAGDLKRIEKSTLVFVAFEYYRANESFFRQLPESVQNRITVLAGPSEFPSVAPEIKCACFCSGLKGLLPREEAQLLHRSDSAGHGRRDESSAPRGGQGAARADEPSGSANAGFTGKGNAKKRAGFTPTR